MERKGRKVEVYALVIVLGTQQTLAANLLFKNNSLCQTFRSLICDLLQWQVHKQRQCSGSLYTREAESKATKTFLSNQGNKEDSYMNNNEGKIHGTPASDACLSHGSYRLRNI